MPRSMSGLKEKFLDTYSRAAQKAVRTDDNVGISLSSGFDSSSVAALASIELEKEKKTLYSYTYVPFYEINKEAYPENFVLDETEAVKKFAGKYPNIIANFENDEVDDNFFCGCAIKKMDEVEE